MTMAANRVEWFFLVVLMVNAATAVQPQQIRIALTGSPSEMQITWTTGVKANSDVFYGTESGNLTSKVTGKSDRYRLVIYHSPYLHEALLTGLSPDTKYYYRVGDSTEEFYFNTEKLTAPSPEDPLRILVIADHGVSPNSHKVYEAVKEYSDKHPFSYGILSGDISYADGIRQDKWDKWGNMVQPLATHLPIMVTTGNHEAIGLFIPYNARFRMPRNGEKNMHYSFSYRTTHFLALNSESLLWNKDQPQYMFAERDFKNVDREKNPWLFSGWHHPWYCSSTKHNDSASVMRSHLEDLWVQQKVDVVLNGHIHAYERTHPMKNWKIDTTAPVYMTDGHAGNHEGLYKGWQSPQPEWSAHRQSVFGFSVMEIHNSTHMHWQMIQASDGSVQDDYWLIRSR